MKKLAIITTHPIQYQIPLFKNLKKNGIDVTVFFASKHGLNSNKIDPEFLKKIKWNNDSNILKGYSSFFPKNQKNDIHEFRLSFVGIDKYLKKENFGHILIFGWNNLFYLKAIYLAIKYKIKIILRVETNLRSKINFLKKIIKTFLLRIFFKKISYFLSIGKLNKEFYLHHGVNKKKILPAPYFVDQKFFNIKKNENIIKKRLRLKEKKIIIFVGKLIYRKNPLEFLNLAKISQDQNQFKFLMIGDGHLKKNCQKYIKKNNLKNVSLLGFVNQKELRDYYKASDLLIVPSEYETWGLNINEAFATNTPVICTSECGASEDLIINGKTGFKYKMGDIFDLQKKMFKILNDKKLYKKMSKNINKKIQKYSMHHTIKSISKILNEK